MPDEPYTFDLMRMFFGDAPPLVYVEILMRTVIMYVYTFTLIRFLGKRESATLSPFELIIVISVGSAVGDPMFYADIPLFHGFMVITTVVFLQRLLEDLTNRFPRLERRMEGKPRILVRDGLVDMENLEHERISPQELFSALRSKGVINLGQVYRAYFEPSGEISVMKVDGGEGRPGLPLFLPEDEDAPSRVEQGDKVSGASVLSCNSCGNLETLESSRETPECERCHGTTWVNVSTRRSATSVSSG